MSLSCGPRVCGSRLWESTEAEVSTFLVIRKYGRPVMISVIVTAAVASFFWYRRVSAPGGEDVPPPAPSVIDSRAQMMTRDFRHVETRVNRTAWILEASVAEMFEDKARLQRVKITYYGNRDTPIIITGRHGRVDLRNWSAVLTGNVRAVTDDGYILKTQQLEWDNEKQRLRAPWPVKIRSKRLDVRGMGMVAKLDESWVRVSGRVTSVVRPPAGFLGPDS